MIILVGYSGAGGLSDVVASRCKVAFVLSVIRSLKSPFLSKWVTSLLNLIHSSIVGRIFASKSHHLDESFPFDGLLIF